MIDRFFLRHPREVGESYIEHARIALGFGGRMVIAGCKCMLHAAFPALFPTAASDKVRELNKELDMRRRKAADHYPDYVI